MYRYYVNDLNRVVEFKENIVIVVFGVFGDFVKKKIVCVIERGNFRVCVRVIELILLL